MSRALSPKGAICKADVDCRPGFLLTTSIDGHLKLWKKQEDGIEFVKHYRASLKAIVGVSASEDGTLFATISEGGEGRVFDVINFGTSRLIRISSESLKANLFRHDQHPQIPLYAESMLLGTPTRCWSNPTCRIRRFFTYYTDIRWSWRRQTIVRTHETPSRTRPSPILHLKIRLCRIRRRRWVCRVLATI